MMKQRIKGHKSNSKIDGSNNNLKEFFLENISRYCDKCGKAYEDDELEILQQNEYSSIIHFECKNCKARNIATFIQPLGITSRVPVNTDLSVEELAKFVVRKALTDDEVLDVHEFLKESDVLMKDIEAINLSPKSKK